MLRKVLIEICKCKSKPKIIPENTENKKYNYTDFQFSSSN